MSKNTSCKWLLASVGLIVASSASAQIRISGSETLESFFQAGLSQYARGPGAGVVVKAEYKGTGQGFKDLCDGRAALVPASAKLEGDALRRCQSAQVNPVELPIAWDAVVVVAHPSHAAMGEITMAELKAIFDPASAGKVMSWAQVRAGQADTPLSVVSLDPNSGTTAFFGNKVHGMKNFIRTDAKVSTSHTEILKLIAANPNAIGFVSLGALAESKAAVWRVPVNFGSGPVVASKTSILNGTYGPFSRLLYVYADKAALAEKDKQTLTFMTWLLEHAARMAQYEGFVPLIDENYADGVRRLSAK